MSKAAKTSGESNSGNAVDSTTSSGMTSLNRHPKPMTVSTLSLTYGQVCIKPSGAYH